jgi:hypothetical protein
MPDAGLGGDGGWMGPRVMHFVVAFETPSLD